MIVFGMITLLMISYMGYWEHLRKKYRVNPFFAPILTLGCQFLVLFIAGILNYLPLAFTVLWWAGLLLFAYYGWKEKRNFLNGYRNIVFLAFFSALGIMAVFLREKQFLEIDNFVHWASVVRNMLHMNRFPGFPDSAISHTTYPLGSAALIYFFCKRTGYSEGMQMLAQGFLLLCCLLPLFSCVRQKKPLATGYLLLTAGFLLAYNIPITELQVDTLLPLAGMAVILMIYRSHWLSENDSIPLWLLVPSIFWVINIKSAGLLYALLAFGMLLWKKRGDFRQILLAGILILVGISIWNHHCSYVYPASGTSQHAVSFAWFAQTVGRKTGSEIWETVKQFLLFTVKRKELLWILAWLVSLGILNWMNGNRGKTYWHILAGILGFYLIYTVGTMGMFVFSMPEADGLPGIERYMRTGDIACYYLIAATIASMLSQIAQPVSRCLAGCGLLVLCAAGWYFQTGHYSDAKLLNCTPELRERLESPIQAYGMVRRRSYFLCVDETDDVGWNQFPACIWRYNMETGAVVQAKITNESQMEEERQYDYLVIFDHDNPIIQKWVQEHYPDQLGQQVIQHFR